MQYSNPTYAADPTEDFATHRDFYEKSAYAAFPQQHRAIGGFGASISRVDQQAIDLIDPPVPWIAFQTAFGLSEIGFDVGDGFHHQSQSPPTGVTVTPPKTEQRYFVPKAHTGLFLTIPEAGLRDLLDEYSIDTEAFNPFVGKLVPDQDAFHTLKQIWRVSGLGCTSGSLIFDGLVLQLIGRMANTGAVSPLASAAPDDKRIARAVEYLEAHLGENITIADLADAACLSVGHFSRTFKATLGEPVWSYVQRRRCERARDMLVLTSETIAEIAHKCGFSSQAHLTTSIKRRFGVTPAAFRNT